MSYWEWKPYVPVAERRRKAEKAAAKARKAGAALSPIAPSRGTIARTFWGKAWCDNLERYSDFSNRLPRGRTYVRSGAVIDLVIGAGEVRAQVMGSSLYRVEVNVAAVPEPHWRAIGADCVGSIDSMVELLQGRLSQAVMQRLCRAGDGLFPAPREIKFNCSCPDWASMCKHVAAVLYGVGARLDERPELLFDLRCVDGKDLLAQAGTGLARPAKAPAKGRLLDDAALGEVFGLDMEGDPAPNAPAHGGTGAGGASAIQPRSAAQAAAGGVGKRAKRPAASAADAGKEGATGAPRGRAGAKPASKTRVSAGGRARVPQAPGAARKVGAVQATAGRKAGATETAGARRKAGATQTTTVGRKAGVTPAGTAGKRTPRRKAPS